MCRAIINNQALQETVNATIKRHMAPQNPFTKKDRDNSK